jgi:hypothetical protein
MVSGWSISGNCMYQHDAANPWANRRQMTHRNTSGTTGGTNSISEAVDLAPDDQRARFPGDLAKIGETGFEPATARPPAG